MAIPRVGSELLQTVRERRSLQVLALTWPTIVWLTLFFLFPLVLVVVVSFGRRGDFGGVAYEWTLRNYARLVDALYFGIFSRSLQIALLTTVLCLLFGYPLAYFIARRSPRWRSVLLLLVMVPFWTNFLVRTFAWMVILRKSGLVNAILQRFGFIQDPIQFFPSQTAVIIGLFYGFLPFMVLPLYASIEKIDFSLVEAAQDLGANPLRAFRRVVLPLTMPGILGGSILVFIPSIGAYVTPELLGGAKSWMIGNLLQQQFLEVRDWPFGSAMGLILMAIVLLATTVYMRKGGQTL